MTVLLNSEIFILTLVIGVYLAAVWLFRKTRLSILNPLLVSIPVLALITHFLGISYESFEKGSRMISFMLGPTVVVLGYLLYEQMAQLKENAVSIITSVFVGCITGVLSVIFIARYFGADHALVASLEPKSVTTPIAMSIAERSGGIPAIAAVVGIFGGLVGPFILERLGIKSRIARGLALGSAAHGLGTAKAMELGAVEGAISGLAIGVMGIMTAILVPVIELFIG